MTELNYKLVDLITAAGNLADEVEKDIQGNTVTSNDTVDALIKFNNIFNELNTTLDLVNFLDTHKQVKQ